MSTTNIWLLYFNVSLVFWHCSQGTYITVVDFLVTVYCQSFISILTSHKSYLVYWLGQTSELAVYTYIHACMHACICVCIKFVSCVLINYIKKSFISCMRHRFSNFFRVLQVCSVLAPEGPCVVNCMLCVWIKSKRTKRTWRCHPVLWSIPYPLWMSLHRSYSYLCMFNCAIKSWLRIRFGKPDFGSTASSTTLLSINAK